MRSIDRKCLFRARDGCHHKALNEFVPFADTMRMRAPAPTRRLTLATEITEPDVLVSALEQAADGIIITDAFGRIQFVNAAFTVLTGYPGSEVVGQFPSFLQSGRQPDGFYEELWRTIRSGRVWQGRLVNRRKDGTLYTEEMRIAPILGPAEEIVGYVATKRSVIEHQASGELETESGTLLRELQKAGDLGCYTFDVERGFWTSSDMLDELLGIDKGYDRSVAGWLALVHPDDRPMMAAHLSSIAEREGKAFDCEYRIVRQADKVVRWVHGVGKLEFDSRSKPSKMRGFIRDITEPKEREIELQDREKRYRETVEQAAVGIAQCSLMGQFLSCNARFAEIIGYSTEEVQGLTFQQITPSGGNDETFDQLKIDSATAPFTAACERRFVRKDASLIWVEFTISTQLDSGGTPLHYVAFVQDISARKETELRLSKTRNALQTSEAHYRTIFQTSFDSVTISQLDSGCFVDVNEAFLAMTGFNRNEVIGRTALDLALWADTQVEHRFSETLRLAQQCHDFEAQFKRKSGECFSGLVSASVIPLDGISCTISLMRDISGAKAAEEEIRNLAFYDPMTALPNRRLLLDRLLQALTASTRTGRMVALLFIDLDSFKTLNDTLGHRTGDLLLQQVARRISSCVRDVDTVARLGGDEFVVMLEGLSERPENAAAEAKLVGEKILNAVGLPYVLNGRECLSTSSIGITVFWDHQESADDVLQKAELAMYQAKAAGRNAIRFFAPALQAAVNERAALEEDLRQAIRMKQFLLYFQPQIDSGRITGAEALIRWKHPMRGILSPAEFILLAEETGLILPLGNWVLESACTQIAAWAHRRETSEISLAINISARQFRQPEFVDEVLSALARTGANPKNLKLELTESMLVNDVEEVVAKMTQLMSHGLRFSLDDFGTGYSSLSYLKRLPLHQLKIDKSFVRDLMSDSCSGAITQAIIALGRAMGLSVIAEGVETEEQRDLLSNLGCNSFQGYLFSRPQPLEVFQRLLPELLGASVSVCQ
jgi:diguanylate cyclase (GGDEF)-like protein/PAS domain S-box-containing protein